MRLQSTDPLGARPARLRPSGAFRALLVLAALPSAPVWARRAERPAGMAGVNNAYVQMQTVVKLPTGTSKLRFVYHVSSQGGGDYLKVLIGSGTFLGTETLLWSASGTASGTKVLDLSAYANQNVAIRFRYQKNGDGLNGGSDTAWVDSVYVETNTGTVVSTLEDVLHLPYCPATNSPANSCKWSFDEDAVGGPPKGWSSSGSPSSYGGWTVQGSDNRYAQRPSTQFHQAPTSSWTQRVVTVSPSQALYLRYDYHLKPGTTGMDFLRTLVNGVEVFSASSAARGTRYHTLAANTTHTIRFQYDKTSAGSSDQDLAWVDNVVVHSLDGGTVYLSSDMDGDAFGDPTPGGFSGAGTSSQSPPAWIPVGWKTGPVEWCDELDNDDDGLVDDEQLWDKTFCSRAALQSTANYPFQHTHAYYVNAFNARWTQEMAAWQAMAQSSSHCKVINGQTVVTNEPYNLQRLLKALLTMYYATQSATWLQEARAIADLMIAAAVPFDPNAVQVAPANQAAWTAWLSSLPTWTVNGAQTKLLYWDTSLCPINASTVPSGYFRYMDAELQGLRGISELARVLAPDQPAAAQKYYDYAAQAIGFYAMAFGGDPRPGLDTAADKRAHYVMNSYDLYHAFWDTRFLDWAALVNGTLLDQATGAVIDQGDLVAILWSTETTFEQGDPYWNQGGVIYPHLVNKSVMDTSHANRIAELVRYWWEEPSASTFAKSMLPKAVNTFLFRIWQANPDVQIGASFPYPTLFRNYPDGSNPCNDPAYSPYSLGNVTFGWNELSRYDRRVLFTMEALTDALIDGSYVNNFSSIPACNGTGSYSTNGTANPGLSLPAIAEMALATRF